MEYCTKIHEKILSFDALGHEEQKEVEYHVKVCEACHKHFEKVQYIFSFLRKNTQLPPAYESKLLQYSLHLAKPGEADYDGTRLTEYEVNKIEKELAKNDFGYLKIDQLLREFQKIENHLEHAALPDITLNSESSYTALSKKLNRTLKAVLASKNRFVLTIPRFAPIAAGVITLFVLSILSFRSLTRTQNPYHQFASLNRSEFSFLTRGSVSASLNESFSDFHDGKYQKTIQGLEKFISQTPDSPLLFYVHYVLGIAYLMESHRDLLWVPRPFETKLVDRGIQNLKLALKLTAVPGQKEDCYWYIGKAYLMQGQKKRAMELFATIVTLRGRRFNDARKILENIQ